MFARSENGLDDILFGKCDAIYSRNPASQFANEWRRSMMQPTCLSNSETFRIRPLGASIAAEIVGLDLADPLSDGDFNAIFKAFLQYKVLAIRDQDFDDDAHSHFARRWGKIQVHVLNQYQKETNPEILYLSNLDRNGKPKGEHPDPGAAIWHSDGSWAKERGLATMLYGMILPKSGGDTLYADMVAAYDGLSESMKQKLAGLVAVHDLNYSRSQTTAKQQMTEEQKRAAPPVEHSIIRIHPETGRKAIYLGQHASHIVGMPIEEGRALIKEINAHATQSQYVYVHQWKLHDFVMWDNRTVMHKATEFDWINEVRTMRRTTTVGERISA
jgi:taurine dioxygenase